MVFEIASSKIAFLISADMKDNFNYYLTKEEIKKKQWNIVQILETRDKQRL